MPQECKNTLQTGVEIIWSARKNTIPISTEVSGNAEALLGKRTANENIKLFLKIWTHNFVYFGPKGRAESLYFHRISWQARSFGEDEI